MARRRGRAKQRRRSRACAEIVFGGSLRHKARRWRSADSGAMVKSRGLLRPGGLFNDDNRPPVKFRATSPEHFGCSGIGGAWSQEGLSLLRAIVLALRMQPSWDGLAVDD